jgi:hypothetical protein
MTKKKENKAKGRVMVGAGFAMIVLNALNYLLEWNSEFTPIGIIGLVFVAVGLRMARGKGRF